MNNTEPASKKNPKKEPVFFKDEHLAVRNDEGTFYLCKTMQNIYIGSRNIKIQWLSNEEHIIPVKENPDQDIYAPDFYDKTDFETILTSVELDKVLGKSKRMILPEEELARIKKILQRSNDKAEGKLDMTNIELTEDNPDGLDISLYKGEDQLDEIEKRKTDKEKGGKKAPSRGKKKSVNVDDVDEEEEKEKPASKPEPSKGRGRPKKDTPEEKSEKKTEPAKTEEGAKRGRRKASKNVSYDQFDFLEEDDDEVMPSPKKRKSQDSVSEPAETKEEKQKTDSEEAKTSEKKDALSTSEKAILAEQQKKSEEDSTSTKDNAEQDDPEEADSSSVKKRGRKPKAKE